MSEPRIIARTHAIEDCLATVRETLRDALETVPPSADLTIAHLQEALAEIETARSYVTPVREELQRTYPGDRS